MRLHVVAAALLLAASSAATCLPVRASANDAAAGVEWRSIGPAISGGRAGAVAGTDSDPSLYYVGAAGGGLWKTKNNGTTWTPVFDDEDVASIGAIAIDPQNEQTVWVGTGESNPRNDVTQGDGVYLTTDGGTHWSHVLPIRNSLVSRIVVDPRDAKHVVIAVLGDAFADSQERGIYRTIDGGATWKKTLYVDEKTGASDLVADPRNPATLYAGMWQFRRTGWSLQSGGAKDGLYRSTDGGATWTQLTGHGLPAEERGRVAIAISPANPKRIYALIETKNGFLWRSDDGGTEWSLISSDPLMDERPFYYSKIFADPVNPDRLFAESVHMTVSTDGGKRFTITGRGTHGDHHAMWISADGKRIIEGDDGGVNLSFDGGDSWQWQKVLPISQLYHIGYSRGLAYRVCGGLQDNGNWCGAAIPLSTNVNSSQWMRVGSGDGTYTMFDPRDERFVWQADAGGNFAGAVTIHDFRTGETREIAPYMRDQNVIDPKDLTYRFNWETPIAFDPFDPSVAYTAGNVLFATRDRGLHWKRLSPDLTRNISAHEVVTGGITLDGTGAETSDTILAVAPSRAQRGEIWIGTDDGLVQLTRDGGTHWTNVTPKGIEPLGRFASISPSASEAGVAYAVYDRHMAGDRTPYVFVTRDFGAHWNAIAAGLPQDDEARSILADPKTPHLLYAGLERSLWASWNDGATWERISSNLPPVSVREIALQPDTNDLLLATHGRGVWVLDDATELQQLARARSAGTYLFPIRDAVQWNLFNYSGTRPDGEAPEYGALISYYLAKPAKTAPLLEILDGSGHLVRSATVDNKAGLNRYAWDLAKENAHEWTFAPKWNRGTFDSGAPVVPGRYVARLHVDGKTYDRAVVVRQDTRTHYSDRELAQRSARIQRLIDAFTKVDDALNDLSTVKQEAPVRAAALAKDGHSELASGVRQLGDAAAALIPAFTSNPLNDQDNDFLPDVLRERLQTQIDTYFDSNAPPTQSQIAEDAALQQLTQDRLAQYAAFAQRVQTLDRQVRAAKLPSLLTATVRSEASGQTGEADRR